MMVLFGVKLCMFDRFKSANTLSVMLYTGEEQNITGKWIIFIYSSIRLSVQ